MSAQECTALAVAGGRVVVAGRFSGSGTGQFDVGGDQVVALTSKGTSDFFVARVIPDAGAVFGQVYNDWNTDGQNNDEMAALAGWTVNLLDSSGNPLQTTTTDKCGGYSFHYLAPGTYKVVEVAPTGWTPTEGAAGIPVTLAAGQMLTGNDFGNNYASIPSTTKTYNGPSNVKIKKNAATAVDITVPDSFIIGDVDFKVKMTAPDVNQVNLILSAPDGTKRFMRYDRSLPAAGSLDVTLSDNESLMRLVDVAGPYVGTYRSQYLLSGFDGMNAKGTWHLSVNLGAGATVVSCSLVFRAAPAAGAAPAMAQMASPGFVSVSVPLMAPATTTPSTATTETGALVGPVPTTLDAQAVDQSLPGLVDPGTTRLKKKTGPGMIDLDSTGDSLAL